MAGGTGRAVILAGFAGLLGAAAWTGLPAARAGGDACREAAAARAAARAAAAAPAAAPAPALAPAAAPAPVQDSVDLDRFLFFSVLETLGEDGVPDTAVEMVLQKDAGGRYRNFVYACPVCTPVLEAFRAYALRKEYQYGRKGDAYRADAVAEAVRPAVARLEDGDIRARGAALQSLVERAVSRGMERRRLAGEERSRLQEALKIGMKRGTESLRSGASPGFAHDACPSCDGGVGREWEIPSGRK